MQKYKTKTAKLRGTSYKEIRRKAFGFYQQIKKKSKRKPYVRSAYFNKDKIFLDLFWGHLFEKKNWRDRVRRMSYFPAAIELLQKSRFHPMSEENRHRRGEILYRFAGTTADDHFFYVQVKQDKRTGQMFLISVFPE